MSSAAIPCNRQREAIQMLDLFKSVGVEKVDITFTDIDGRKREYRTSQTIEAARSSMRSSLIQSCVARQRNIIVRPHAPPAALLIQLDDLVRADLVRVAPAAFLILRTSPGNCQAWVAVKGTTDTDLRRRVKKAAGADPSASGAARIAGSVNFKPKYQGKFPTVVILRSAGGRMVTTTQLAAMGLVAVEQVRASQFRPPHLVTPRAWPSYARSLAGARINSSGGPDSWGVDFTWCVTAADWGHKVPDIAARLLEVSDKARKEGETYAVKTAERAAAVVSSRPRAGAPPVRRG